MRGVDFRKINASKRICNVELYEKVAEELNLPSNLVEEVIKTQFDYTEQVIQSGTLESIIFVYLGKFKTNHRQIQKMMANSLQS